MGISGGGRVGALSVGHRRAADKTRLLHKCGQPPRGQNGSHLKSNTRSASHVEATTMIAAEPKRNMNRW